MGYYTLRVAAKTAYSHKNVGKWINLNRIKRALLIFGLGVKKPRQESRKFPQTSYQHGPLTKIRAESKGNTH